MLVLVLVLGIVKASLKILGIGIGVKKWYCSCLRKLKDMVSLFGACLMEVKELLSVQCLLEKRDAVMNGKSAILHTV